MCGDKNTASPSSCAKLNYRQVGCAMVISLPNLRAVPGVLLAQFW